MLRIRKISNPYLASDKLAMEHIKSMISVQFPDLWKAKIDMLDEQMVNPLKFKYHTTLFVAENIHETILGFAVIKFMPDHKFCFLDLIATSPGKTSSGVGGVLYQRVREEAEAFGAIGLFFECLPDDPELCENQIALEQNRQRLAFYERFGARPFINTKYETPVKTGDDCPPFLMFDSLGRNNELPKKTIRIIVRTILKRIYGAYCSAEYIRMVVNSFSDDPAQVRPLKYNKKEIPSLVKKRITEKNKIFWVINDTHSIHHIHQKGYVESPVRISQIKKELEKTGIFRQGAVEEFPEKHILNVHDNAYVQYFKKVCNNLPPGKSVYPYVFPIRNVARPPKDLSVRAGYYCIDSFTPLNRNALLAARMGVNCTLTAANEILSGTKAAYVLTRPPGHHAEKYVFGGFCYFNNNAIAAHFLSRFGKVAILDIDYHHGNGQQQIFYSRNDVFTVSLHGHPSFAYPYFSGFRGEKGEGEGLGYNHNFPLRETIEANEYRKTLKKAIRLIKNFKPAFLIVAFGLDTAKGDPTGTWKLTHEDFEMNGTIIGELCLPTIIVQEGGYRIQTLGQNAKAFFSGFIQSHRIPAIAKKVI
jgi:acetoin utilization deacetylase AcuC-like enzyme